MCSLKKALHAILRSPLPRPFSDVSWLPVDSGLTSSRSVCRCVMLHPDPENAQTLEDACLPKSAAETAGSLHGSEHNSPAQVQTMMSDRYSYRSSWHAVSSIVQQRGLRGMLTGYWAGNSVRR